MRLYIRLLALVLLAGLILGGCSGPGADRDKLKKIVVDSLKVQDIAHDGGDGLLVSWKPLPKEYRVQEYRIYRGVDPDSLFFIASVPINVKTGVVADTMFYYDSGYNTLIDINSPGKLKNEKQNKGSIIYRQVPRVAEIAARMSEHYDLLSYIEDKYYYYRTKKTTTANSEDEDIYAGLGFNQQTILASLKSSPQGAPPQYYYYTVVPVNERSQYLGVAKPVKGFAQDDAPERSPGLYCAALEDRKTIQFEWDLPLNNSDLMAYAIYALPAGVKDIWETLGDPEKEAIAATQGRMLDQNAVNSAGYNLKNYVVMDFSQPDKTANPLGLSFEEAKSLGYVIQFYDYSQNTSPLNAKLATPTSATSADLPLKASFRVEDKAMDKGDRLSVIWEQPIVQITNTTALNKDGTKIKLNYQINQTDAQKINNIYFEFYEFDKDKPFAKVNEFYQDNSIKINIPEKYSLAKKSKADYANLGLKVKMTIATKEYKVISETGRLDYSKPKLVKDYELVQYLKPDPVMLAYMPTNEFFRNGLEVSEIKNVVYRKGYRGSEFVMFKRNTSFENNLDVTVPYVTTVYKPVVGVNFVKGDSLYTYMGGERYSKKLKANEKARDTILLPSKTDMLYDAENETMISVSLYADETRQTLKKMKAELSEAKKELRSKQDRLRTLPADSLMLAPQLTAEIEGLTKKLESQEKTLKIYEKNPGLKKAMNFKSNRGLMSYVESLREPETRKYNYMVVRTDGKGLFVESDLDQDKKENLNYYIPISNWFDWNKLVTLIAVILFGAAVVVFVNLAKRGKDLYMRPIAGLQEIDNAIGRATEMGRPMLYCMGNGGLSDVATLASMGILSLVAKKAAEYDTKLIVPCYDYIVMPIAQEIVREAHYAVGRPDSYDKNNVFYLTSTQFAYVAGVNGIMIRERMATNFFMGYFAAEALLMTETGNAVGAVQIAGSDAITQIPFFITTCDYTLIGEELYAASAYLNREPMLLGTLKGQDYFKFLILVFVIAGALLATFQITGLMQLFPLK